MKDVKMRKRKRVEESSEEEEESENAYDHKKRKKLAKERKRAKLARQSLANSLPYEVILLILSCVGWRDWNSCMMLNKSFLRCSRAVFSPDEYIKEYTKVHTGTALFAADKNPILIAIRWCNIPHLESLLEYGKRIENTVNSFFDYHRIKSPLAKDGKRGHFRGWCCSRTSIHDPPEGMKDIVWKLLSRYARDHMDKLDIDLLWLVRSRATPMLKLIEEKYGIPSVYNPNLLRREGRQSVFTLLKTTMINDDAETFEILLRIFYLPMGRVKKPFLDFLTPRDVSNSCDKACHLLAHAVYNRAYRVAKKLLYRDDGSSADMTKWCKEFLEGPPSGKVRRAFLYEKDYETCLSMLTPLKDSEGREGNELRKTLEDYVRHREKREREAAKKKAAEEREFDSFLNKMRSLEDVRPVAVLLGKGCKARKRMKSE